VLPVLAGLLVVLVAATVAPAGPKPPAVKPLAPTTKRLVVSASTGASCARRLASGALGVSVTRWTAPVHGYVQARLTGDAANDWDLALFDAKTGRQLDASLAWGANELVQAKITRGRALTLQACRLRGSSAVMPLEITPVAIPLARRKVAPTKQSLVAIPISGAGDFNALDSMGFNLNEVPNRGRAIAVLNGPADATKLEKAGYSFKTLIPDMAAAERRYRAKDARAQAKSKVPSGRTTYRRYPDVQADFKKIVKARPNIARPLTLPVKSFQGRDIFGVEMTKNVKAKDDGKPIYWLMAQHHAREWPAVETATEFALYLSQRYGKDERVTNLLKRVRVVVSPVINPDGYISSRNATDVADLTGDPAQAPSLAESVAPPGGSMAYRRKNCHEPSDDPSTPCELQYGVDNNRNYGQNWGGPGASPDPTTQNYRGEDMWSEPENQAVWRFSQRHNITTLVTVHNFASLVLRPPGTSYQGLAPDEIALKKLGDRMARSTGYVSQYGFQLYNTSGTTEDWNYAAAGTYGYTIELGPDSSHGGNFHIEYQRAVVNQWTGAETIDGKGKGLRDAYLAAGETAADRKQFPTLKGTAPPGARLRVRKEFKTFSDDVCALETTGVDCTEDTPRTGVRSRDDFLDYTTIVPESGKYNWIVTPSTRPFVRKAGRTEQWTLTCEDPVTGKVHNTRKITADRGQTVIQNFRCGAKRRNIPGCVVDKRKLDLHVDKPDKGYIKRIDVYVNGKRVRRLKGEKARKGDIYLRELKGKRGKFKVTVVAHMSDGTIVVSKRTYRGCKKTPPKTTVVRPSESR
jgi:hypothetical protein